MRLTERQLKDRVRYWDLRARSVGARLRRRDIRRVEFYHCRTFSEMLMAYWLRWEQKDGLWEATNMFEEALAKPSPLLSLIEKEPVGGCFKYVTFMRYGQ